MDELLHTLKNPSRIKDARRINECLLCRRRGVNEAGICNYCYGYLEGEELKAVIRILSGRIP